jgi:ubiquinone biosynthesis monooxygenase Coq7
MREQEVEHLRVMNELITDRRVRPSALLPVWEAAGFALGAATAAMGKEAAMACTVAVEEVIGGHYNDQIRDILQQGWDEEELLAVLKKNRDEELEHLETANEQGAEQAPLYGPLTEVVKAGCKAAIQVAKRV